MPIIAVTSILAAGFLPMFTAATAPATARAAADAWAQAYVNYVQAGGMPAASAKQAVFAQALLQAFQPELAGGGPALFMQALSTFWLGMPVPAQVGAVSLFIPSSLSVVSPQSDQATPQQQSNGLAQVVAGLTLGSVKVQPFAPGPPVPLI